MLYLRALMPVRVRVQRGEQVRLQLPPQRRQHGLLRAGLAAAGAATAARWRARLHRLGARVAAAPPGL